MARRTRKSKRKGTQTNPLFVMMKKAPRRRGKKIDKFLKDKMTTSLRYVDVVSIDAGSASIAKHTFRANSAFDPDHSSTGHQPLQYDEIAAYYANYRVLSSKIKVSPVATATSNVIPCLYGVYRDADSTLTYALGTSIVEDARNKGSWGVHSGVTSASLMHGNRRNTRTTTFNAKRQLSPEGANNSVLVTANPADDGEFAMYYQLWAASIAGNNPGSVSFLVQIDYLIEFTEPKVLTPS